MLGNWFRFGRRIQLAAVPTALLAFEFDQIIPYLQGDEAKAIYYEILAGLATGLVNGAIQVVVYTAFGLHTGSVLDAAF